MEQEVLGYLEAIPTCSNAQEQISLLHRIQEIVFNRDPSKQSYHLLHLSIPYLRNLFQLQNAPFIATLLNFLAQAVRAQEVLYKDLFEFCDTIMMLSYSSEKNICSVIQVAISHICEAFSSVLGEKTYSDLSSKEHEKGALWKSVMSTLETTLEIVVTGPIAGNNNNNRSVIVWLRAWKYLERAALLFSFAKESSVFRDPARSSIHPDSLTIDNISPNHPILNADRLASFGSKIVQSMCNQLMAASGTKDIMKSELNVSIMERREYCVAINSLSLIACLRPIMMSLVIPCFLALCNGHYIASSDTTIKYTMKANLVKILSQPAAQSFADEVTECLIGLGASERAFRAISKSKEPRRKYVSAPSEASLKRANFSKRTAEKMSSSRSTVIKVELEGFKRRKIGASHPETITYEGIVDMPSTDVANLVLQSLRTPLPAPLPPNVKLLLPPSELKMRIIQILSKIATPSSVFVIDVNNRRLRDPRRRRSKDELSAPVPLLLPIFDEVTLEEMAEWISQNASTIAEPPVSVSEDNLVQVYLKPVTQEWCREMAVGAVTRILENEYGTGIRGDGKLREQLMCRIACDRWLLNGNKLLGDKLPSLYQVILDFCVEDLSARSSLIVTLMYHEYVQSVKKLDMGEYSKLVCSILQALMKNLDLTVSGNKKNFGYVLSHIPLITVSIVKIIQDLFTIEDGSGIVLGITSLRDIVKERKNCGAVALNLLLRYTCADAESCRNSSIRCVANQLYTIEDLKASIENHAIHLVKSLKSVRDVASDQKLETILSPLVMPSDAIPSMFASAMKKVEENYKNQEADLLYFAKEVLNECDLSKELDTDQEIIRRLDLFLALCAKKPALFGYLVSTYADSSDRVQQVMFTAIEKLVKHFKQRGSVDVVSYLYDFEERSLPFVCHVIQILCARAQPSEELVGKVLTLYREHDTVVDAVSVLIPILPDISSDEFFPLLPHLISLSSTRFSVALSKLLGGNSKVAPMNFLLALHHVDLKADVTMQKKVIEAINSCIEDHQYRAAFPSDVLLQVCRTLLEEDTVPKLSLRTLIQSVTVHPILQKEAVELLSILVDRSVWKMEDAIWKGFIKCSILVQPHSFPLLLQKLPVTELKKIFDKEPELHKALKDYVISQGEEELSALDEIDAEAKEDREEDMEDIPIEREEIKKQITKPLEIPSPVMELLGI